MTEKESLTGIAQQMTEQTKGTMENYFSWLQKNMSALPWSNTNLNRVLLSNATQIVTLALPSVVAAAESGNLSVGGVISQLIAGGAGGAILTAIIGAIKNKVAA